MPGVPSPGLQSLFAAKDPLIPNGRHWHQQANAFARLRRGFLIIHIDQGEFLSFPRFCKMRKKSVRREKVLAAADMCMYNGEN